ESLAPRCLRRSAAGFLDLFDGGQLLQSVPESFDLVLLGARVNSPRGPAVLCGGDDQVSSVRRKNPIPRSPDLRPATTCIAPADQRKDISWNNGIQRLVRRGSRDELRPHEKPHPADAQFLPNCFARLTGQQ